MGKSRPAVANALRLLALPDAVKAQLEAGALSAGHARAVLSIEGVDRQVEFARSIEAARSRRREAEARRGRASHPAPSKGPARVADIHLRALADDLTRSVGTRVRITRRARGGAIEIEFYSDAELERLARSTAWGTVRARSSFDSPGGRC